MEAVTLLLGPALGTLVDIDVFEDLAALHVQKHTLPNGGIYACIRLRKSEGYRRVYLHRWLLNCPKGFEGDHHNGNTLDNRRGNLRISTHGENARNSKKRGHSSQPYKGIRKSSKSKWHARLRVNGITHHSCGHDTPEEAAHAYDVLARKLHGEYARTNWPEKSTPPSTGE